MVMASTIQLSRASGKVNLIILTISCGLSLNLQYHADWHTREKVYLAGRLNNLPLSPTQVFFFAYSVTLFPATLMTDLLVCFDGNLECNFIVEI